MDMQILLEQSIFLLFGCQVVEQMTICLVSPFIWESMNQEHSLRKEQSAEHPQWTCLGGEDPTKKVPSFSLSHVWFWGVDSMSGPFPFCLCG